MRTVVLKCSGYLSLNDFYADVAEKLELPEFEQNIGGLRECLCEIQEEICIGLIGYEEFSKNAGIMTLPLRAMLSGIPDKNRSVRVAFL